MPLKTNPYDAYPCCKFPDYAARRAWEARAQLRKKVRGHEKGYCYTIGYANCVGRWSGGGDFPQFSGSSYNRSLKVHPYAKDSIRATEDLVCMANKVRHEMRRITDWPLSREINALLDRGTEQDIAEYDHWLCEVVGSKISHDVECLCSSLHTLSPRSRGKVKDKATAFYRASPGSRVFLTLTFIQSVSDQQAIQLLNSFLTAIRQEHKGFQYIWIAERQKDTHNIHFHLIINRRLAVRRYNALWVLQQYNAGLRGKTRYGESITMQEVMDRYDNGTMQKILNPLDIRRVKSISGLSSYLTKYISKQEKGEIYGCLPWHCSRGVSKLFIKTLVSRSAFAYLQTLHNYKVDKDTGEMFEPQVIKGDYWIMVYINNKASPLRYLRPLEQINKWILKGHRLDRLPISDDDDYRKYFLCQ